MDWKKFISQYDIIYETPPSCWQDGFLLGNGSMGSVFYADQSLQWVVNKTDIIDGRVHDVREIIPPDEAEQMVRDGASIRDFRDREMINSEILGLGPKSCCLLTMDLATSAGAGTLAAPPNVHSRMSLHDATLYLQLDKHLCHPKVESFMHAAEDVLVINVRDVSPLSSFMTKLYFSKPYDIELPEAVLSSENGRIVMKMSVPECGDYVAAIQVIPRKSNALRAETEKLLRPKWRPPELGQVKNEVVGRFGIISVTGDFDVFITVASGRECDDPLKHAHEKLDSIIAQSHEQQKKTHTTWWHDYWQKSWVELGDKALEQLFYSSLYIIGSNYRKAPMPGLLGLLYGPSTGPVQISPWTGDMHNDLNVQCPFYPVHALNHSELFESFLDMYESFLPTARRLALEIWGVSGAHFDMCFNAVGKSVMGGVGNYRFFYGGSYVALMHCLCWRYRRDVEQLRTKIYPFLKEVLDFYLNIMKKDEDGTYHLWPCHACELDVADVADAVLTTSTLQVCLQTATEAAGILNDNGAYVAQWKDVLDNFPSYPTGTDAKGRNIILDGDGIDPNHHVGQAGCLYPVYPCGQVDAASTPEEVKLYNDTLDSVLWKTPETSYACDEGFYFRCVWQCFFRAMTALRLGRKDDFWDLYLPMFLRCYSKPNGTISHDAAVVCPSDLSEKNINNIPDESLVDVNEMMPKREPWHNGDKTSPNIKTKERSVSLIEGSSDYLTMVTETLLQSQNGLIRVFPGWPEDKDAQFVDFVAEGNIAVSSKISIGKVEFIKLKSRNSASTQIKVLSPWTQKIETLSLDANVDIVLTASGLEKACDTCQEPSSYEAAKPRKLYEDKYATLWIGRK